jgi:small subunit ribosomal protein S20
LIESISFLEIILIQMPNKLSSKKAHRVSLRRNAVNTRVKAEFKAARKSVIDLSNSGKVKEAKSALKAAQSKIDIAVKKGAIHKKTGDRYKSRVAAFVKKSDTKESKK